MLTGSIPGDHLSHFIVESNDNVDAAGLKNTFAIDVPAVHATAVKLTGLGFYDRIKHLIGEPADKHQLSIVPSLRWAQRTCRARRPLRSTLRSSSFSRTFLVVISDSSAKAVLRQADVITPPTLTPSIFCAIQSIASSRSSLSSNLQVSYLMFHSAP